MLHRMGLERHHDIVLASELGRIVSTSDPSGPRLVLDQKSQSLLSHHFEVRSAGDQSDFETGARERVIFTWR